MYHHPVLLKESVDGLNITPQGIYADVTFGGGGHSKEILKQLGPDGRLIAFDQDEDSLSNRLEDSRFQLVNENFQYLKNFLRYYNALPVDGILADLGISSHQIDVPGRGFSTRFDGPLDMRMDKKKTTSAQFIVNTYPEEKLVSIFRLYAEVENASKLAATIVATRPHQNIDQFKISIKNCIPRNLENKYLAQVFQALRIEVNDELTALQKMLLQAVQVLKPGGRLVVISYHSLEDRLVKNFIRSGNFLGEEEKDFFGNRTTPFESVTRKPIVPSEAELKENPRARSAKLRIATKK